MGLWIMVAARLVPHSAREAIRCARYEYRGIHPLIFPAAKIIAINTNNSIAPAIITGRSIHMVDIVAHRPTSPPPPKAASQATIGPTTKAAAPINTGSRIWVHIWRR